MEASLEGVRAVFFDLDDTLLAYDIGQEDCWRAACRRHVPDEGFPDHDTLIRVIRAEADRYWSDDERHRVGRLDLPVARRRIVTAALEGIGILRGDVATAIADEFTVEREKRVEPLPGAIEAVQWIRSQGLLTGLITNGASDMQRCKLTRHGIESLFEIVLVEGEVGFGKPDPRVFLRALELAGVRPGEAWMVGDRAAWDVIPPIRLGMRAAWIRQPGADWPASAEVHPTLAVGSVAELAAHWQCERP